MPFKSLSRGVFGPTMTPDLSPQATDHGFALYVHWPYCLSKCPYCDFNSHVASDIDHPRFKTALLAELSHIATTYRSAPLRSIFFGGGTPSLMEPDTVSSIIDAAVDQFGAEPDLEITLEANPTSVEASKFKSFAAAGVNRVSIGVQSLDDHALKALGRTHSVEEALGAVAIARDMFSRVSFDLIYARPGQSESAWRDELQTALDLKPDHLSLYQLTIEPETRFYELQARGKLALPQEDHAARLYQLTQEMTGEAGLPAYEISNHARPGEESRHNLVYWRYGTYGGIGPGAHGRQIGEGGLCATQTLRSPQDWLKQVEAKGHGMTGIVPVGPGDQASEMLMMGLRLAEGISLARYQTLSNTSLNPDRLANLMQQGFLELSGDILRTSPKGRLVLNALLSELLT